MIKIEILPSIMCANLSELRASLKEMEAIGIKTIHVDILDGHFSPSMPIGLDIISKIRENSNLECDVHIMSQNNEFFILEALKLGASAITFHCETTLHIDRMINIIKKANVKAGIALNPATSLSVLDYILPYCDFVLLMLMNPGFAGDKNEKQVPYACQKVLDLKNIIEKKNLSTEIIVDGRVSMEVIPNLVKAGATKLVAGSTSLFLANASIVENKNKMESLIKEALKG